MTHKIKEVNEATAIFFRDSCIGQIPLTNRMINPTLAMLYESHGGSFNALANIRFSAFCRAVADRLHPRHPPFMIGPEAVKNSIVYLRGIREAMRLGIDYYAADRDSQQLLTEEIDRQLKKAGLLGEKEA